MIKHFTPNKTVNEKRKILCNCCNTTTLHRVLSSLNESIKEQIDDTIYFFDINVEYEIIVCQGCETISFRSEGTNSEDFDSYTGEYYITELIYPKRSADTWVIKTFMNVPFHLQRIYRETIDCYNNEILTLCAAGIRAIVEGVCKDKAVINGHVKNQKKPDELVLSKSLPGKINGLHEKGFLTKQHADFLHEHRALGNSAVHELKTPAKEELGLAIEILESAFDTIYELPHKGLRLQKKRQQK